MAGGPVRRGRDLSTEQGINKRHGFLMIFDGFLCIPEILKAFQGVLSRPKLDLKASLGSPACDRLQRLFHALLVASSTWGQQLRAVPAQEGRCAADSY